MPTISESIREDVREAIKAMIEELFEKNTLLKAMRSQIDFDRTMNEVYKQMIDYAQEQLKNRAGS